MDYLKKTEILEMEDYQLINAFERIVTEMTKVQNFTKKGVSPKMGKQFDWVREEILSRMKQ